MASFAQLSDMDAGAPAGSASDLSGWLRTLGRRIATCASTCADYTTAAGLYEELRGLSDAELERRGLSRATLARDLCAICDRAAHD
jgi:hypothetical protein